MIVVSPCAPDLQTRTRCPWSASLAVAAASAFSRSLISDFGVPAGMSSAKATRKSMSSSFGTVCHLIAASTIATSCSVVPPLTPTPAITWSSLVRGTRPRGSGSGFLRTVRSGTNVPDRRSGDESLRQPAQLDFVNRFGGTLIRRVEPESDPWRLRAERAVQIGDRAESVAIRGLGPSAFPFSDRARRGCENDHDERPRQDRRDVLDQVGTENHILHNDPEPG